MAGCERRRCSASMVATTFSSETSRKGSKFDVFVARNVWVGRIAGRETGKEDRVEDVDPVSFTKSNTVTGTRVAASSLQLLLPSTLARSKIAKHPQPLKR